MKLFGCVIAFVALVAVSGCGGPTSKAHAPVFPVSGKVTYKGQPVVGADITFISESANRSAFGRTDDEGNYRLSTFGANDGAVEGKQIVLVSKSVPAPATNEAPIESPDYVPPGYEKVKPAPTKAEALIPFKYATKDSTDLVVVVNADKAGNTCDFELKD